MDIKSLHVMYYRPFDRCLYSEQWWWEYGNVENVQE